MSELQATVFIVDDDQAVRESLAELAFSVGLQAQVFGSSDEFLQTYDPQQQGCLLLDVRLPGMSGLRLQDELTARGIDLPIIFMAGYGDVPTAVEAMKEGAFDFFEKPVNPQMLLDRIQAALAEDLQRSQSRARIAAFAHKLALLTPREREVLQLLTTGKPTSAIAKALGISQKTAQAHRLSIFEKMQVDTVAGLVTAVHEREKRARESHRTLLTAHS